MSQGSIHKLDHFTVILLEENVSRPSFQFILHIKMPHTVTYTNLEMIYI